jgi:hypothetical protein
VDDAERAAAEQAYAAFLPINPRFKEVCTRWQMRDGGQEPNDHTDADYDAKVIEDLGTTHDEVVVGRSAARFARYAVRFGAALERVRGGDTAAFARPMSHSYHDVWMELHEDLLLTLGRERDAADGH